MSEVYNSNQIKYGSFKTNIMRGAEPGTQIIANAIFEGATVTRAVKETRRPNEIGSPNGFFMTKDFDTGNAGPIQIPKDPTNNANPQTPRPGDWFVVTLDSSIGAEKFVLGTTSQPFEMSGYYKISAPITRDNDSALTVNPNYLT
jgi:hypothetical protein